METVTLRRIIMMATTDERIYAPSQLLTAIKVISYNEFLARYADKPQPVLVSFEPDFESNPRIVTAYASGMSGLYIVDDTEPEFEPVVIIRSQQDVI